MGLELLSLVIVVLGIILLAYLKIVKDGQHRSKVKQVYEDIANLRASLNKYWEYYGHYPVINNESDDQQEYVLYQVLAGKKFTSGEPYGEDVAKHNPDLINFIEVFMGRRTVNGCLVDPWGSPYNIYIDTNNDTITEIDRHYLEYEDGPLIEHYHVRIGEPFAIWSNGPNQTNDLGLSDDIASWRI